MIEIKVTIDASENLLAAINALTGKRPAPRTVETKPAKPVETKPAIAPQTKAPEEAPVVELAPDEPEQISDEQLRQVIKSVRDKSTPAAVREIFAEFGIKTSIECPMERRPELVERLNKLAS